MRSPSSHFRQHQTKKQSQGALSCGGRQVIQQWYLKMPEELSKLLAARGTAGKPVKSDEEREQLERRHEIEFLRTQGNYTDEVRVCRCAGLVRSLWSVALKTRLLYGMHGHRIRRR